MRTLVGLAIFSVANAHLTLWNNPSGTPSRLHPVQGLYVKPSVDGSTGDLYVAATEDNGIQSQWVSDQPINFLAAPSTASLHATAPLPLTFTSSVTTSNNPNADKAITTQKRAIISQPMKYKYNTGYPLTGTGNEINYPYGLSASAATGKTAYNEAIPTVPTSTLPTEGLPNMANFMQASYMPYQFFYPGMMPATFNPTADSGDNDELSGAAMPQAPVWPTYAYPMQYVMVDPSAWAASQAGAGLATSLTTSSATANESNQTS